MVDRSRQLLRDVPFGGSVTSVAGGGPQRRWTLARTRSSVQSLPQSSTTDLQTGLIALTRAVVRPESLSDAARLHRQRRAR